MKELIEELIADLKVEIEELEEDYDNFEDFNAMDASGGNFDDAYYMGYQHGGLYGKYNMLHKLLKKLEEKE